MRNYRNTKHFLLVGDNNEEIFQILMYLLQHNLPHICILFGGYKEFHRQAVLHKLPIYNHSAQCYLCNPHLEPMKLFLEKTRESANLFSNWLHQISEEAEEEIEMPPSNVINGNFITVKVNTHQLIQFLKIQNLRNNFLICLILYCFVLEFLKIEKSDLGK